MFLEPLFHIYSLALSECKWPRAWVVESVKPIPKKKLPETVKDVRPISITPIFSKILERLVRQELRHDVSNQMHVNQFSRIGTDMYIAYMMHDAAVVADRCGSFQIQLFFDFSQAFNSVSHTHVLQAAASLGARPHILRILSSYLSGRKSLVYWNDTKSSLRPINGGAGQGTILSSDIFTIAVNGLPEALYEAIHQLEDQDDPLKSQVVLFADDLRLTLNFKKSDMAIGADGLYTFKSDGRLEHYLSVLERFTVLSGMKLNRNKTEAMVIDNATENRVYFPPNCIRFPSGESIQLKDNVKIIGFQLASDLSLDEFVKKRKSSGHAALWDLRRIANKGVPTEVLLEFYKGYVRSRIEYAVAAVLPSLGEVHRLLLESIQKKATKIILKSAPFPKQPGYKPYTARLEELKLESLSDRWNTLFEKLCLKIEKSPVFTVQLPRNTATHDMTLRRRCEYVLPTPRTDRLAKTVVSSAARFLNSLETSYEERVGNRNFSQSVVQVPRDENVLVTNLIEIEEMLTSDLKL